MAITITSYAESAWHTAQTTAATTSLSWNAGDIIVTLAFEEGIGSNTPALPTGSGLTFTTLDVDAAVAGTSASRSAFAIAGSSGSGAISCTFPVSAQCGIAAFVISGASGIGDHKEQHTATKTVASTRLGNNSVYLWGVSDTAAGTSGTGTPAPTHTRQTSTGNYTVLVCDLTAVSTNQSYGQTGGGATGPFSLLVVEVLEASASVSPPAPSVWPIALGRWRGVLRRPFGFQLPGDFAVPGVVFTDSGAGSITLTGSGVESHVHSNSPSGTITLGGSFAQAFSHSGSASGQITLAGTRVESQTGSNTASGTITLAGTRTESETHSRSASGTITLGGTGVEDFHAGGSSFNDSGSGTVTLGGSFSQSLVATDSRTGTITLTGTGVESFTHSGSRTGTITLTGTANEVWGHVDSGTGTITLAGTRTESQAHSISSTGTVALSGTFQEDFHGFIPPDTASIRRLRRRRWPQP